MSIDLVRMQLARPIDWTIVEEIAYEVLSQDDFPDLRPLGGVKDGGIDAQQTAFYDDGTRTNAIVQVTSQEQQAKKFIDTVKRLRGLKTEFTLLVMVFRGTVDTSVKTPLLLAAKDLKIALDIRDEDYLVKHLANYQNGIFVRHFGSPQQQVDQMLGTADPLEVSPDRMKHAMLASIGAYVLNPRTAFVRSTLFDRAVLATIAASARPVTLAGIAAGLTTLLPGETVTTAMVAESVKRLIEEFACEQNGDQIRATESTIKVIGATISGITAAIERMHLQVVNTVATRHKLTDAMRGRIQRNLKRAITLLLRHVGPTLTPADSILGVIDSHETTVDNALAADLPPDIARTVIISLSAFVRDHDQTELLAILARSYAALSLRNVDPLGRRFQQAALARAAFILDTDALLALIIEELPEHAALKNSLNALAKIGVQIVAPTTMIEEVVGHIDRARKSLKKAGPLNRMPAGFVEAKVTNAVVRGFFYAMASGHSGGFEEYWAKYHDPEHLFEYIEHLLRKRVPLKIEDTGQLDPLDSADYEKLLNQALNHKERNRLKAEFRDESMMKARMEADLKCLLNTSRRRDATTGGAGAYLVSSDSAFDYIQKLPEWNNRPRVHLRTSCVPELADLTCGAKLTDDEIVRAVFNPVHVAAAEQLRIPLLDLIKVGVDLHKTPLDRLEWDVSHELQGAVNRFNDKKADAASNLETKVDESLALATAARKLGYEVDQEFTEVLADYGRVKAELVSEKDLNKRTTEATKRIVAAASKTEKGKRRVQGVLRELGIELPADTEEADDA